MDELIQPDHVFPRLVARDKARLLADLAQRAAAGVGLPAGTIAAALLSREALGSTGVGDGIALPHARLDGLSAPVGFFARLDRPLDYDAIDGRKVDLVFLLLSPPNAHLPALAAISRRLREASVVAAIRGAKDAAAIRAALVGE